MAAGAVPVMDLPVAGLKARQRALATAFAFARGLKKRPEGRTLRPFRKGMSF
jgi:hypothetical protein